MGNQVWPLAVVCLLVLTMGAGLWWRFEEVVRRLRQDGETAALATPRFQRFEELTKQLVEKVGTLVQQGPRRHFWGVALYGVSVGKTGIVPVYRSKSGFATLGQTHEVVFLPDRPLVVGALVTTWGGALVERIVLGRDVVHEDPVPAHLLTLPVMENVPVILTIKTWV
jgi:hypothetical protein